MAGARICLGQIGAAHGVAGEVRLYSFTVDPAAIADYGPLEAEDGRVLEIETLRPAKDHFIARLSGIGDRDAARALANVKLYVPRDRLPEPEEADEFYHADLIGLAAVDRGGERLGTVVAVHNFGAGDLIEVRLEREAKTELIAFDAINVPMVDISAGRIVIAPSPLAGEGGEAKPSRAKGPADKRPAPRPLRRAATAGTRRHRSARSRTGRR